MATEEKITLIFNDKKEEPKEEKIVIKKTETKKPIVKKEKESFDIVIEKIDDDDVGTKKITQPIEKEFELAIKDIENLINDKYRDTIRLRCIRFGGALIVYQGTPTTKWAAFRTYMPHIYRASLKRILYDNGIIDKYPTYFKNV